MQNREKEEKNILEVSLEKKTNKKLISFLIIAIILVVVAIFALLLYIYLQTPEHKLNLGASIEEARLNENNDIVYIKLVGGINYGNITKIKFIFKDAERKEYYYETSEGTQEISVPFKRSFLDWLLGRQFEGKFDYEINASALGLNNFNKIDEVSVVFEYKTQPIPQINGTTPLTNKTTNQTKPISGGGSGGATPGCTAKTCSDYPGQCGNSLDNGCSGSLDCSGNCRTGEICNLTLCVSAQCTSNNNCTSFNNWKNVSKIVNFTQCIDINQTRQEYSNYSCVLNLCQLNSTTNTSWQNTSFINKTDGTLCSFGSCQGGACVSGCTPKSSCNAGECGTWNNGTCSGTLKCGGCGSGYYCSGGSCVPNFCLGIIDCTSYTDSTNCTADVCGVGICEWNSTSESCYNYEGNVYYSDPVNGNTTTGNGSVQNPWGTLESVVAAGYFNGVKIKSGDIVKLKNGYHGELALYSKVNTDYITIEADDGATPELSNIILKYSSYWHFKGLRISPDFATPSKVNPGNQSSMIGGYSNNFIIIENCNMFTVDNASSWDTNDWTNSAWSGVVFSPSTNTIARNNVIRNVRTGFNLGTNLLIENNTIDGFSGDGMYGAANSILQDNIIINKHNPTDGFHNDGIQAWGGGATNITIRRNYINARTDPNRNVSTIGGLQGIFLENEVSGIIENNVVLGTNSAWGIGIGYSTFGLKVLNNTVMRTYDFGGWPNIVIMSIQNTTNTRVSNNIVDGFPSSNSTNNIVVDHSLKITNYNDAEILTFFVDYPYGDVRPLINSPICNGSVNPPGIAVGALPCVCTQDSQCIEVFGAGATCDVNTEKCVGSGVGSYSTSQTASLSPFTKFWNFIKSLLTAKTGKAITGNAIADNENLEKLENFITKIINWIKNSF